MVYVKEITLDFDGKTDFECITAVQGDNGTRFVKVSFTQNNQKYIIPENVTAVLRAVKPDGHIVFNPCTIEDNKVTIELTDQILAVPGVCNCEVTLYGDNGCSLTSARFLIKVRKASIGTAEIFSSSEFKLLQGLIEQVYGIEASITANIYSLTYYHNTPTEEQRQAEITTITAIMADTTNHIVFVDIDGMKCPAAVTQYGGNIFIYALDYHSYRWYEISYFPDNDFLQYGYMDWSTNTSNVIPLTVPTLVQGASDYTDADKAAVQAAIDAVAEAEKPVIVLNANGSLIPAAYYKQGAMHYFVGISPDSLPGDGNGGEVWLTYVKYNTSNGSLTVNDHANAADDGEWLKDIADLEADFRIPTNNLVYRAIKLALEAHGGGNGITVDAVLDANSANPVQNKVIAEKITEMETTVGNIDILLATI